MRTPAILVLAVLLGGCGEPSAVSLDSSDVVGLFPESSPEYLEQAPGASSQGIEEPGRDEVGAEVSSKILLKNRTISVGYGVSRLPSTAEIEPESVSIWMVHWDGPIQRVWVDAMHSSGLVMLDYLPENTYVLAGSGELLSELLRQEEHIDRVEPWTEVDRLSPELAVDGDELEVVIHLPVCPETQALTGILDRISVATLLPDRIMGSRLTLARRIRVSDLSLLASQGLVYWIEPYLEPRLFDEVQDQILAGNRGDVSPLGPGYAAWLQSQPVGDLSQVVVDVCDTGLDNGVMGGEFHPDFGDRIRFINNFVSNETSGDDHGGHGTINASIVGGDGVEGTGLLDPGGYLYGEGVAVGVGLGATAIFDNSGYWNVGSASYSDLVSAAWDSGARLSTNSWGASVFGSYDSAAREYDALVRDVDLDPSNGLQPMALFFAAGNDGSGSYSVGSPGTAKNVITVGASENYRMNGTDGCLVTDASADNLKDIANFSSRGPCDDGRMKPDLVAPGTHIQGAASVDPSFNGTSVCDQYWPTGQTSYARSSGTSHSTPAVAGVGALAYSWYSELEGLPPSPAMLKAILVGHTDDMAGGSTGAGGTLGSRPDNIQGWGLVNMGRMFSPEVGRVFVDQTQVFDDSGQTWLLENIRPLSLEEPVKVVLAWTDAPGSLAGAAYTNNLNLEVERGDQLYLGNVLSGGWSVTGGLSDSRNNVEAVLLQPGVGETFSVRVSAENLPGDGIPGNSTSTDQDFALYIFNATLQSPTGFISLSKSSTSCNELLEVTVSDEDLQGETKIIVQVTSTSETLPELIQLEEVGDGTGIFKGMVELTSASAAAGDGRLHVAHGEAVIAAYHDLDDGSGAAADVTAQALVDCLGPQIYGIEIIPGNDGARITWKTDEAADSSAWYWEIQASENEIGSSTLGLNHQLDITGLAPCTAYRVRIGSADSHGNLTIEDNQGLGFLFTTGNLSRFLDEPLDSNPGWTTTGEWSFGPPTGSCGDPGSAFTGANVYGTALSTCYSNNSHSELTTASINLGLQTPITLNYRRWLTWESPYDDAELLIDDGNGWHLLFSASDDLNTDDGSWAAASHDLSPYAGRTVQLRWSLDTDFSVVQGGWNIDDITIEAPASCPGTHLPPTCILSILPGPGTAPLDAVLDASSSEAYGATISRYIWAVDKKIAADSGQPTVPYVFEKGGVFPVSLTVVDSEGATASCSTIIDINSAPTPCFVANRELLQLGESVTLDASCSVDPDGTIQSWTWDLGTGEPQQGESLTHTYDEPGVYQVRVTIMDDDLAQVQSEVLELIVNAPPQVGFEWTPEVPSYGRVVAFDSRGSTDPDGEIRHWEWDFDDGVRVNDSPAPLHVFPSPGDFEVSLKITDNWGGIDELVQMVHVNVPPVPVITRTPEGAVFQGSQVLLDSSASSDPDGQIEAVLWTLPGGSTSSEPSLPLLLDCPGTYEIRLEVTDDSGAAGEAEALILVKNLAPQVQLTAPVPGLEGAGLLLQGAAVDSCLTSPLTWAWDLGDGEASGVKGQVVHAYRDNGTYQVNLCVTDELNAQACDQVQVVIANAPPVVNAGPDRVAVQGGLLTLMGSFTDPGQGDTHTSSWDFGDGTQGQGPVAAHAYLLPGTYTATLTVEDDDGGIGTDSAQVVVGNAAPVVNAGEDRVSREGDEVHFLGQASDFGDEQLDWRWDFGDGEEQVQGREVDHLFIEDGTYQVVLTVTDSQGLAGTDSLTVTVSNQPPVVSAPLALEGEEGGPMLFSGSFTDPGAADTHVVTWLFGDGAAAGTLDAVHTYADNGDYVAVLQVADDEGAVSSASVSVLVVNLPPVVDAGGERSGLEGGEVGFHGTLHDMGVNDTHTILWDFGDGSVAEGTLTPTHVYAQQGEYLVTLTATDDDGGVGTDTTVARIGNNLPLVDAGADKVVDEGGSVHFQGTGTDSGAGALTWEWHFGDGTEPVSDQSPDHVFEDDGAYVVTLTVTDQGGLSASDTLLVTVLNRPPVLAEAQAMTGLEGAALAFHLDFTDPGVRDDHTWLWSFGDGTVSTQESPTHVFADNGVFTVSVRVADDSSAADSAEFQVTIENQPPLVNAGPDMTAVQGQPLQFHGTATDPAAGDSLTLRWDFGDGGTAEGLLSPLHTFLTPGPHTVTLTAEDDDGAAASDTLVVTVQNSGPVVDAGEDLSGDEGVAVAFSGSAIDPGGEDLAIHWDFGDGSSADGSLNAQHVFADNGEFLVTLSATDSSGATTADTLTVSIRNQDPTAIISGAQAADEGLSMTFTASAQDPGEDQHTFTWIPGDGSPEEQGEELVHTYPDDGTYQLCLTAQDDDGGRGETCVLVFVYNRAPVILSSPETTATQDEEWTYQVQASDPAGVSDPLLFTLDACPSGMGIDVETGLLTWTPDNSQVCQSHEVVVRVIDDDGGTMLQGFQVQVANVNEPPLIISLPPMAAVQDQVYTYRAEVEDPDTDLVCTEDFIEFELLEGPEAMTVDPYGLITWTPDNTDLGNHLVLLSVRDSGSLADTQEFTISVSANPLAPVAMAGSDRTLDPGLINLDGSNSYPGQAIESWTWTQVDGPADADLSECQGPACMVRLLAAGTYAFELVVTDHAQRTSPPDQVRVTVKNLAPVAMAGFRQVVEVGHPTTLDGGRSSDVNGDELSWSWSLAPGAPGAGLLENPDSEIATLTPGSVGQYEVRLVVGDGLLQSQASSVVITAVDSLAPAVPPVALVRETLIQAVPGESFILDAGLSYDPDGQDLTLAWTQVDGPVVVPLDQPTDAIQTLNLHNPGVYTFRVTADDGSADSLPAEVVVLVASQAHPLPVADAGADLVLNLGEETHLDGSGSMDPGGIALSWQWTRFSGPLVPLDDPSSPQPRVQGLFPGTTRFSLRVTNAMLVAGLPSRTDLFVVTPGNNPPVADAGPDQVLEMPGPVTLDGTQSHDPDGDQLSYIWVQVDGPAVVLSQPDSAGPGFTAAAAGRYGFMLLVEDDEVLSRPAFVTILVPGPGNQAPVAAAGEDLVVYPGSPVTLDGSASFDPEGMPLTYLWSQVDGPETLALSPTLPVQTFAPETLGTYTFSLVVHDGLFSSQPDTVTISVESEPMVEPDSQMPEVGEVVEEPWGPDVVEARVEVVEEPWSLDTIEPDSKDTVQPEIVEQFTPEEVYDNPDGAGREEDLVSEAQPGDQGCGCKVDDSRSRPLPAGSLLLALLGMMIYSRLRLVPRISRRG